MKNDLALLMKPHFSTRIYRAYLYYLSANFPQIDLYQLCEDCGLSYDYIRDETNWVSVIFDERFTRKCIELTGQSDLCYRVGQQQMSEKVVGKPLYLLGKYSVSVSFIYSRLPVLLKVFSRVTDVEIVDQGPGSIRIQIKGNEESLSPEEALALRRNFSNIFLNTLGYYVSVPTFKNLPPAQVSFDKIPQGLGLPYYDINVKYQTSNSYLHILFLCCAILLTTFWFSVNNFGSLVSSLFALTLVLGIIVVFFGVRYAELKSGFNGVVKSLHELDQRYVVLYNAKESATQHANAFERFVPKEFMKILHRDILDLRVGDHVECEITTLFCDLRNFTHLSEQMTPNECFEFINAYFGQLSPAIRKHGGFIDKYMGDNIMAIFPHSPIDCLQAAIEMCAQVRKFNLKRKELGQTPIRIGIGINTGKVIVGAVGHSEQIQTTVMSDSVNTASRLEKTTKAFDINIIASRALIERLPENHKFKYRCLGRMLLPGKDKSVEIFQFIEGEEPSRVAALEQTKALFERAVALYDQCRFVEATENFIHILKLDPHDQAARFYLKQLNESTAPDRWKISG